MIETQKRYTALEAKTWNGQPMPPMLEAMIDRVMADQDILRILTTVRSRHIDLTMYWPASETSKRPEVRIS